MKQFLFLILATASILSCKTDDKKLKDSPLTAEQKQQALKDTNNFTTIQWLDSTIINLGNVKEGSNVEVAFRFKNTGTKQLVIGNVSPGCGCTIAEKPELPIAPGEESVIKGTFKSGGQSPGEHRKYITVTSNTNPSNISLEFIVNVTKQ